MSSSGSPVDEMPAAGSWRARVTGGLPVLFVRDKGGTLRAFLNVCRHRGNRVCREPFGRFGETIQCAYHAWTYGTDGRLVGAPHMQEVEGFDKREYGLHAAALCAPDGALWMLEDANPGRLFRVTPK